MNLPLMPKATAIWLVENTSLTFKQIADFCGLHILEVESIADGDMDTKLAGFDPIISSQLTHEEIERCEKDPNASLNLISSDFENTNSKVSKKYTPRSKRQDKPDAIAWIVKYYPELPESDVCSLLGTTKATVRSIKNKTHKNFQSIKPRSPVAIGLCTQSELDFFVSKLSRE